MSDVARPLARDEAPSDADGSATEAVECANCGHVGEPVGKGQCSECRCWLPRNGGALVHGRRRYEDTGLLPPELSTFIEELRGEVVEDLGGEPNLSRIQLVLVDRLVELEASARLMLDFALRTGADTKRGRESLGDHRASADSQLRVARALGMKRIKREKSLAEYMAERAGA